VGAPFQAALRRRRGDVGGGRDGALHPFGYCAVMIAHACARPFQRGWARWSATWAAARINGCCAWTFRGRCSPGSINHGGWAEVESYLATHIRRPRSSSSSHLRAPPLRIRSRSLLHRRDLCSRSCLPWPSSDLGAGASPVALVDGDSTGAE
jgi:hypothetical protein